MKFSLWRGAPSRGALSGLSLAVAVSALAQLMLAPAAQATTDLPAPAAARSGTAWLATQLAGGVIHNPNYGGFDDLGLTLDIGLSMDVIGGDQALVRQLRSAMSTRIEEYVTGGSYGDPEFRLAGELAKSLVFAQVTGADPATYGGYDLVAELEDTVTDSGPSAGRVVNYSPAPGWGDYANSFSQALAVRGLSVAGSPRATEAIDFLLQQQCSAGFFRIFFNTDPASPDQSCVDGTDGIDTDTTAFVVSQLAAVSPRTPVVEAAMTRAVAWLVDAQRADGSFVGSAFTPDPNANSTGLAASALAVAGRCEQAGKAAEWVSGVQVGPQAVGSPLVGDEGAIAYSAAALTQARDAGITDEDRPTWWRTSVQAVAGLTQMRGAASRLTIISSGTEPGSSASLIATGGTVGDRFCLSGPGIAGSRAVVVGSDGTLRAPVTLPAVPGAATYTFTGRDGAATHAVAVRSANAASSVAGVRLVGPTGFRRAGTKVTLDVLGAPAGARFVLRGPGANDVAVFAASDGVLSRTVTLPATSTTASYVLVGADGQVADDTRVLGRKTLRISTLAADGPRTRVLVRRLAPRERVRLVVSGTTIATGRANPKGRYVARVRLPGDRAEVKVRAVGQFPAIRSGSTVVTP